MPLFSYFLQNYILKFNSENLNDTKYGKNIKVQTVIDSLKRFYSY